MRFAPFAAIAALAVAACAQSPEPQATDEKMMPVEPDGGIGDGAGPPDAPSTGPDAEEVD